MSRKFQICLKFVKNEIKIYVFYHLSENVFVMQSYSNILKLYTLRLVTLENYLNLE